jgi:hypothetical protein
MEKEKKREILLCRIYSTAENISHFLYAGEGVD